MIMFHNELERGEYDKNNTGKKLFGYFYPRISITL